MQVVDPQERIREGAGGRSPRDGRVVVGERLPEYRDPLRVDAVGCDQAGDVGGATGGRGRVLEEGQGLVEPHHRRRHGGAGQPRQRGGGGGGGLRGRERRGRRGQKGGGDGGESPDA